MIKPSEFQKSVYFETRKILSIKRAALLANNERNEKNFFDVLKF